jgi:hypothetical protein
MKNVVLVLLAAGVVVLGVLYLLQCQMTRDAQEQVAELEGMMENELLDAGPADADLIRLAVEKAGLAENVVSLESKVDQLQARIDELENEDAQEEQANAFADEEDTPATEETADTGPEKVARGGGMMEEMGEYMGEMLKNPEMRQMLRDNLGPQLNMMYGDLFDKLFLDEPQLARFKGLLTDMQMLEIEKMFGEDKEDTGMDVEREEITGEMEELLGDDRYRQYEDYQNNLAEMMALSQYKKRLTSKDVEPLADYQEVQLLSAIKEEKQNFQFATTFADNKNMDMTRFTQENIDKYFEEKDELTARILDRSRDILTEEQFVEYKSSMESQIKMERMGMEMAVKMYGPKSEPAPTETTDTATTKE